MKIEIERRLRLVDVTVTTDSGEVVRYEQCYFGESYPGDEKVKAWAIDQAATYERVQAEAKRQRALLEEQGDQGDQGDQGEQAEGEGE